jgi:SM-20-related protein
MGAKADVTEHAVGAHRVKVYDDLLPLKLRQDIHTFATRAPYLIGWADNDVIENNRHQHLHANCSSEQLAKLGLLMELAPMPVFKELQGLALKSAVINLSWPGDVHFAHAHPEAKVLLYYVNLQWQPEWFGETLFFDEALRNIELALPYTPGRIVVFDGAVPHAIRPQSHAGPAFRFTLALLFERDGQAGAAEA